MPNARACAALKQQGVDVAGVDEGVDEGVDDGVDSGATTSRGAAGAATVGCA